LSTAEIAVSLFILEQGYLADVPLNRVTSFEAALHKFIHDHHLAVYQEIETHPVYTDELKQKLKTVVEDFKRQNPGYTLASGK